MNRQAQVEKGTFQPEPVGGKTSTFRGPTLTRPTSPYSFILLLFRGWRLIPSRSILDQFQKVVVHMSP